MTNAKNQANRRQSTRKPVRVYMCFAGEQRDSDLATELQHALDESGLVHVIDIDRSRQWHSGAPDVDNMYNLIGESDAFILIHTKTVTAPDWARRIRRECSFAMYHANNALDVTTQQPKAYPLVRVVFDDLDATQFPGDLATFRAVDYRDPHSLELSLDRLLHALTRPDEQPSRKERLEYVFREALGTSPRREMISGVFQAEFERAFRKHVIPLSQSIQQLAELSRAQDNLMTPEIISVKESAAFDDIWVVSHSLHNDLHAEDIVSSIIANLQKGIRYTYFVPKTRLIEMRLEQFCEKFSPYCGNGGPDQPVGTKRKGGFAFLFMDAGVFMPFDELVVYDGENPTQRWGYIQMRYDLATKGEKNEGLIMKVPDRTLNTIVAFLLAYKCNNPARIEFPTVATEGA